MVKTKVAKGNKSAPGERFLVNKDNTIMDNKAGLMIIQDPTLLGEAFKKVMTFADAHKAIADLNIKGYGGFKDWRLPTVEELVGMTDRTKYDPCYNTTIFKGKFDDCYWSGERCAWNSKKEQESLTEGSAWCVLSGFGLVGSDYKYSHFYVRPVRSCQ